MPGYPAKTNGLPLSNVALHPPAGAAPIAAKQPQSAGKSHTETETETEMEIETNADMEMEMEMEIVIE